jgi:hypothetical protein
MNLNTLPKKITLAILIAFGSVVWLNTWHQYVYTRSRIDFPPVSNRLRDTLILLIPVLLAVWIGAALTQWIISRSNGRMSVSTQSILTAGILGGITSITISLIETTRGLGTGIGNQFIFLASICNRVYPNGNLLLSTLKWIFPGARALRYHILVQDGVSLMLFNLAIIILLIIIVEGIGLLRNRNSYAQEAAG